jgi:predicted phage-related endonuclease
MPDPLRETVSASEAAALFNVSPYLTRWQLWRRLAHGEDYSDAEDVRMDWGKRMQPLLLQAVGEEMALEVIPNYSETYHRNGLIGCTRDAEIIHPSRGPGALEAKVVFDYRQWMDKWDGGDTPPREYEIQLQTQMAVGLNGVPFAWGVLTAWIAGETVRWEREPIPELWESLHTEAAKLFADIKAGREPDPFGVVQEVPMLNRIFTPQEKKVLDMREHEDGEKWAQLIADMEWNSRERLSHKKAEKAIKAKVQALMADNGIGLFPHGITTKNKRTERAGYTVKPTAFNVLSCHVPADLPYGRIKGFDDLPEKKDAE